MPLFNSSYFTIIARKIRGLAKNLAIIFLAKYFPREYMIPCEEIFAREFGLNPREDYSS